MNKKAQTEQIFQYIFVLVVTAAVIFIGFKGVGYIKNTGQDVELANFYTDVKAGVERNYNLGELSKTDLDLLAPPNTRLICFLNPKEVDDFSVIKDQTLRTKISGLSNAKDDNLYISLKEKMVTYKIENMKAKDGIQCKQQPGDLKLIFENKGAYTELEIK